MKTILKMKLGTKPKTSAGVGDQRSQRQRPQVPSSEKETPTKGGPEYETQTEKDKLEMSEVPEYESTPEKGKTLEKGTIPEKGRKLEKGTIPEKGGTENSNNATRNNASNGTNSTDKYED